MGAGICGTSREDSAKKKAERKGEGARVPNPPFTRWKKLRAPISPLSCLSVEASCRQGRLNEVQMPTTLDSMKLPINCSAFVAALALCLTPTFACFVPQQVLLAGQNDCCQQMGPQCATQGASSPQSCCGSSERSAQPYLRVSGHSQLPDIAITAILFFAPRQTLVSKTVLIVTQFHLASISPPASSPILRI